MHKHLWIKKKKTVSQILLKGFIKWPHCHDASCPCSVSQLAAKSSDSHRMPHQPSKSLDSGSGLTIINAKDRCSPNKGSQKLGSDIKWELEPLHPSKGTHCKRHSWVDVAPCKEEETVRPESGRGERETETRVSVGRGRTNNNNNLRHH